MEWAYPPRIEELYPYNNLSSHGISVYVRCVCLYCQDIIQARFLIINRLLIDVHLKYMSICFDYTSII